MPPQRLACVERAAFSLNEMAAVGTHEVDKRRKKCATITNFPIYFGPPLPAPEKKYGLRRRLHLQIRDTRSCIPLCYRSFWKLELTQPFCRSLRIACDRWVGVLGTYIRAFNPIVDTTLYTIMIYANQSTLASRIREIPFGA